jgi:predicted Ser/Thr protein kinase
MQQLMLFTDVLQTEFTQAEIIACCNSDNFIGRGVECSVYRITDIICFKLYRPDFNKQEIKQIYETAKYAAKYGVAPQVYQLFENGYTTEIVRTLDLDCCEGCMDETGYCVNEHNFDCPFLLDYNGITDNELKEFYAKLSSIFASYGDLHNGNIGLDKNGNLVLIDFGFSSQLS